MVLSDCLLSGHSSSNTLSRNLATLLWEGQFTWRSLLLSKPRHQMCEWQSLQIIPVPNWAFPPEMFWNRDKLSCTALFAISHRVCKQNYVVAVSIAKSGVLCCTAVETGARGDTWVKVLNSKTKLKTMRSLSLNGSLLFLNSSSRNYSNTFLPR